MSVLDNVFSFSPVKKTRRHHALEHATLQILSRKNPQISVFGYSDMGGFWVVGNVATEAVCDAVEEALSRLRAGEATLAIHPNCGSNYVVAGVVAGGLAWLAMAFSQGSWRRKLQDLPVVIALSSFGFMLAQPLGIAFQTRMTIDPQPGEMKVAEIRVNQVNGVTVHRIITRH